MFTGRRESATGGEGEYCGGGNKEEPLNYRPVSLSSVITKLQENTKRQMDA